MDGHAGWYLAVLMYNDFRRGRRSGGPISGA